MSENKPPDELQPCPYCGGMQHTIKVNPMLNNMAFIVCEPCGAVTSFVGNESREAAIKAYNKRIVYRGFT